MTPVREIKRNGTRQGAIHSSADTGRTSCSDPLTVKIDARFNLRLSVLRTPVHCDSTATIPQSGPATLQILVHGGTYNRWFWDPSAFNEHFSYVLRAADRGLATLSLDMLGSGTSAQPHGDSISLEMQASALSEVLGDVRTNELGGRHFDRVVLVGHSLGSAVISVLLDRAPPVDAVVLTGFTRYRDESGPLSGLTIPAADDPKFARRTTDGYTTLPSGSRPYMYYLPTSDPAMLLADEEHRDVTSRGQLRSLNRDWERVSNGVTVPVLVAAGRYDFVYRWDSEAAFRSKQRTYFPNAASVDSLVLDDTGHNLFLHGRAPEGIERVLDWIQWATR
jgi:pimeloyl-ACP methyl ester carboxylesterase